MGTLSAAIQQIEVHPGLHHLLTLDKFNQYSRLIVHLKSDILLPQPLEESHSDKPPRILSPSIVQFLAGALSLAIKDVNTSWDILRTYLWNCQIVPLTPEDFDAFKHFGWELGLSKSLHNYSVLYSNAYIQLQPLFIHPLDTVPTRVVTMVI